MKNYSQPRITLAHPSSSVPLEKASLPSDQTGTVEEPNLEMQKIIYAECGFFFLISLMCERFQKRGLGWRCPRMQQRVSPDEHLSKTFQAAWGWRPTLLPLGCTAQAPTFLCSSQAPRTGHGYAGGRRDDPEGWLLCWGSSRAPRSCFSSFHRSQTHGRAQPPPGQRSLQPPLP